MSDNWIDEENARAIDLTKTGKTTNQNAPKLVTSVKNISTKRSIRSIYIQDHHQRILGKLIFEQKIISGKKAPELLEEAIELIASHYTIS